MNEPTAWHWLSYVAAPMLVVRADRVVAMNPAASALFGSAQSALPVELATLFGSAVATLLRTVSQPAPDDVTVNCTIGGVPGRLTVAARLMEPASQSCESLWALTLCHVPEDPDGALAVAQEGAEDSSDDEWVKLLPTILDRLPVALFIEDQANFGVFINRGFTDIFEYELDEIADIEDWWVKLYPDPQVREDIKADWMETLAKAPPGDGTISTSSFQVRCGSGADKMVEFHSFRISSYLVHTYVDVTHRHRMAVDLQELADTDALTGVRNRRGFMQGASVQMRIDQPVAALLIDVDHFKQVNDRLGHAFGDQVLAEIAARCRSVLRAGDILARLGGEEFAVLLPRHDDVRAALVAERLRSAIAATPVSGPTDDHVVTISIGGACAKATESSIEDLLLRADRALYAAKRAGRNCVRFAGESPEEPA